MISTMEAWRRSLVRIQHGVPCMIQSPCVKICKSVNGVCTGCYRTDEEITDWYKKSDTEKLEILENIKERKNGSKGKRWKIF